MQLEAQHIKQTANTFIEFKWHSKKIDNFSLLNIMVVKNSKHFMMTQPNGIVNCNVIRCDHLWCPDYHREILTRVVRLHLIHSAPGFLQNDALSLLSNCHPNKSNPVACGLLAIKITQTFVVLNSNLAYSLWYQDQSIRTNTSYNANATDKRPASKETSTKARELESLD